jgi:amidase
MTSDIHYLGLLDISERIRRRELTSEAVVSALLERIRFHDRRLNSILMLLDDRALEDARRADSEIAAGFWRGPLHGVPIGVKDLLWTKGLPTTAGMEILKDFRPQEDATVVARLKSAGAVLIAKLHMSEGAMIEHHPKLPRPSNPWSAAHWTGGSSSGSGVAVAAGFCYGALGSDTGGSIRMPSEANNVTGIKPTWGRVSRYGLIPLSESLDHIGPMARSAADAAAILQAIAGADPRDPTALPDPVPDYLALAGEGIHDLTIGVDWDYATGGVAAGASDIVRKTANVLQELGAHIREVRVPWGESEIETAAAMPLFPAEVAVAHAEHYPEKADYYSPSNRGLIESGRRLDGMTVARAYQARDRLKGKLQAVFRDVDLILTPGLGAVLPTWEAIEANKNDPRAWGAFTRFTLPFNMAGVPTISLPGGFTVEGLPIGIQLIGPALAESVLIRAGVAFQAATDFHTRHPALDN